MGKDNEKNKCSPFLMCEDYDAYLESMSKTELLEYFHFVMGNYKHSLDKVTLENTELQKKVDELAYELAEKSIATEGINVTGTDMPLYLHEKLLEQAVKDTAREIYLWLEDKDKRGITVPFNMVLRQLKERYGVEVE